MSQRIEEENLKRKNRSELVDIARDLGLSGLFSMSSSEIIEKICKNADGPHSFYLSSGTRRTKSKLLGLPREELIQIGEEVGVEGMFSMTSRQIAESIYAAEDLHEHLDIIEQRVERKPSPSYLEDVKSKLIGTPRDELVEIGRLVGVQGMLSMTTRQIAEEIYAADNLHEFLDFIEDKDSKE